MNTPQPYINHDEETPLQRTRRRLAQGRCPACSTRRSKRRVLCEACARCLNYCPTCEQVLPRTAFHKNAHTFTGLAGECKDCLKAKRTTVPHIPCRCCGVLHDPRLALCPTCRTTHKWCSLCQSIKKHALFRKNRANTDGLDCYCAACRIAHPSQRVTPIDPEVERQRTYANYCKRRAAMGKTVIPITERQDRAKHFARLYWRGVVTIEQMTQELGVSLSRARAIIRTHKEQA